MARIADWYFRLATILVSLALVQVHAASQTVLPICHLSHDTKIAVYHEDGTNLLVARGNGSVTLQDVTCTCYIGKPVVTVFFLEGESGSNHSLTSPICEGDVDPSCVNMTEDYEHIDQNKVSKVNITGTFTKTAVIECGTLTNPNKGSPLIVLVEPVPVSTPSQSTLEVPSPSEIVMSTTATTEDVMCDDSTEVIDVDSFSSTTACATLTSILASATTTVTVSATTTLTVSATTTLTVSPTFCMSKAERNTWIASTGTVIPILIIILLVVVTVTIMIARSNHRSGTEQISATNPIVIEHTEIHTEEQL